MFPQSLLPLVVEQEEHKNEFVEEKVLDYTMYQKTPKVLYTYRVPQLKQIAKYYRLGVSGAKQVLIDRVENFFLKNIQCILLQRVFRGSLVRRCFRQRGEGFRNRGICVNDTDFYSMEPLSDIPAKYFFSFCCGKTWYGCSIISLIHLIQSKPVVKNPYTREPFTQEVVDVIKDIYSMACVVFGVPEGAPSLVKRVEARPAIVFPIHNMPPIIITADLIERRVSRLMLIREKTVPERVQTLFMEIDQLGNYTHSQWFMTLERRDYIRLFRTLYDIWAFRGQLTRETKLLISILEDPFYRVHQERVNIHNAEVDVIKEICLRVMENMVYNGVDDEYRKIGALHVLTALTGVSVGARASMPWLYEALYY